MNRVSRRSPFYAGVFLTSLATLLLELSLTRIFSVVLFYHFAFLVISIALFGLGLGGVFSYLVAEWRGDIFIKLAALSAANAIVVLISLAVILKPGEPGLPPPLVTIYFASSIPFFLSGVIVSMAISEAKGFVDRAYLYDLTGAAAGCLLLVPLLNYLGGPNTALVAGLLLAAASALWCYLAGATRARAGAIALAAAFTVLIVINQTRPALDVTFAKGKSLLNERFSRWNSFSRIALAPGNGGRPNIFIDADASTEIAKFDFATLSDQDRRSLLHTGQGLAYRVRPGAKTLIIGPGGGPDVARALASGSTDVTGVEINPIIADEIMRQRFPELSNGLYLRPDVHIFVDEGRSFVRRSKDRFQVIQATMVDTWASTAAGALALAENNLYTVEAFEEYLSHLTPDGILVFTRWGFDPPRESLRLLALARVALVKLGEHEVSRHVAVARQASPYDQKAVDTILISRKPLLPADVDRLRAFIDDAKMQIMYLPGEPISNVFSTYLLAATTDPFERAYRYDVSAVSDNRPFFFFTVPRGDLLSLLVASHADPDEETNSAVSLLHNLVGTSLLATLMVLVLPPILLGARLPLRMEAARLLPYFGCIGVGYILVEVSLIQKFVLFLGHPTYALTVVIFLMLLSSGAGSFASRFIIGDSKDRWLAVVGLVPLLVVLLSVVMSPLLSAGVGWPLALKIAVAALLIVPAGFAMGMPFPQGLARLELAHSPSVRWAWSINAAASVLGSVLSMILAIYQGLAQALLSGAVIYVAALGWAILFSRRVKSSAQSLAQPIDSRLDIQGPTISRPVSVENQTQSW